MQVALAKKAEPDFRSKLNKTFKRWWFYRFLLLLLVPGIIFYVIFSYFPMYGVIIAFKDYKFTKGILGSPWIGFMHFQRFLNGEAFWEVARNTVLISFYKLIFGFPAPIILALLLNEVRHSKVKKTIQTITALPNFLAWTVLAGILIQLLSPSLGPINYLIRSVGLKPIYFLGDPKWFRSVLVVSSIWKSVGWSSIIYLASISNVNPELYESATIDGASRFQRAVYITIPSISNMIVLLFIFSISSLVGDDFDQIFNLYNTAVYEVGDVISTYTFRIGITQMQYSFGAAVGLFLNVISLLLMFITNFIARRYSDYGIW